MASKHLKELLSEEQEPFVLKSYIDEKLRKCHLQVKKRKPIAENSSFSRNFCKNACFFSSSTSSPDVKKSPLFDFRSPAKSPCRNSNTLFFHIPARTSALLLEAALRIQQNSASRKTKSKSRKSIGFGLFGSILKRITNGKRNEKKESKEGEKRVYVKDIIRWDSLNSYKNFTEERRESDESMMGFDEKMVSDTGFSCSCTSRLSSVWSESNEEKSFDLETSSSRSEDSEEMNFVDVLCEKGFCSSPFEFVLHNNSLSPCCQSPKLDTFDTERSPTHNNRQVVNNERRSLNAEGNICEEEDKEQNSPVCVLDPPFEDDDDQEDAESEKDCFELEHNFANVQRAKQQLLHKLRIFERLAELDPVELEKRIAEQEDEDREVEEQCRNNDDGSHLSRNEKGDFVFVRELLTQSNMYNHQRIPSYTKRLVLDLVAEERGEDNDPCSKKFVAEKVCKRLELWKEVNSNTIDMMVEIDFRTDAVEWAKNPEQMQETAVEIELAIFGFLVDELSDELLQCSSL